MAATEAAQWVKAPITKPDVPSLVLGIYVVEGDTIPEGSPTAVVLSLPNTATL